MKQERKSRAFNPCYESPLQGRVYKSIYFYDRKDDHFFILNILKYRRIYFFFYRKK
jgi:hypothetical protein